MLTIVLSLAHSTLSLHQVFKVSLSCLDNIHSIFHCWSTLGSIQIFLFCINLLCQSSGIACLTHLQSDILICCAFALMAIFNTSGSEVRSFILNDDDKPWDQSIGVSCTGYTVIDLFMELISDL